MVEPTDPRGILDQRGEELPAPIYTQKGKDVEITVPKLDEDASGKAYTYGDKTPLTLTFVDNGNGAITYKVPSIPQSVELRPMWNYTSPEIVYKPALPTV